jgi:nucleotidyltransferase/DNA polymerase involved in DNA repair
MILHVDHVVFCSSVEERNRADLALRPVIVGLPSKDTAS